MIIVRSVAGFLYVISELFIGTKISEIQEVKLEPYALIIISVSLVENVLERMDVRLERLFLPRRWKNYPISQKIYNLMKKKLRRYLLRGMVRSPSTMKFVVG